MNREFSRYFVILVVVWLIYAGLNLFAPAAESVSRYGLTLAQAQLLRVTIILPMLLIWSAALFSVVRFKRYTNLLNGSTETEAFKKITLGLFMLFLVIMLPSIINAAANFYPDDLAIQRGSVIVRNYLTLTLYLIGFWSLWKGSESLVATIKDHDLTKRFKTWALVAIVALGAVYAWAVFHNPFRTVTSDPLVKATYYLPDPLIALTIVLPYVLIWLVAVLAIFNFWYYAKQAPGIIYRQTFSYVASGLTFTIILLIFLQFLSQANAALSHAALSIVLIIIYLLLFAIAVGYLLVARGAKKLTAIEEVK